MTADVRVGIVSWNTGELLGACLDALPAALGALDAEVVVVDNASDDDSVRVARRQGVAVEALAENTGYARGMNRALAGTDAPFLVALNPDTVPQPRSLETLVAALRTDDRVAVAAPRLLNPDLSPQHSVYRFPGPALAAVVNLVPVAFQRGAIARRWWLEDRSPHDRRVSVDWAIGAVHAIRASALDGETPYRERWFMYVEDLDLCWRVRRRGWDVVLEPAAEVVHVGNAAGAQAWGETRTARWLDATYDWMRIERGPLTARAYAALNAAGSAVDLAGARARRRPRRARDARAALRVHARAMRQTARDPDVTATPVSPA